MDTTNSGSSVAAFVTGQDEATGPVPIVLNTRYAEVLLNALGPGGRDLKVHTGRREPNPAGRRLPGWESAWSGGGGELEEERCEGQER